MTTSSPTLTLKLMFPWSSGVGPSVMLPTSLNSRSAMGSRLPAAPNHGGARARNAHPREFGGRRARRAVNVTLKVGLRRGRADRIGLSRDSFKCCASVGHWQAVARDDERASLMLGADTLLRSTASPG